MITIRKTLAIALLALIAATPAFAEHAAGHKRVRGAKKAHKAAKIHAAHEASETKAPEAK